LKKLRALKQSYFTETEIQLCVGDMDLFKDSSAKKKLSHHDLLIRDLADAFSNKEIVIKKLSRVRQQVSRLFSL